MVLWHARGFWQSLPRWLQKTNWQAVGKTQESKHQRQSMRKKASWHGYIPRHAGCRMTMRLTQNNSVTMMQTIRRNPSMQNRTILIQRDRALSLSLFVIDEANGTLSERAHVQYLSGNWWAGTLFRNENGVRRQKKISNFSFFVLSTCIFTARSDEAASGNPPSSGLPGRSIK